MAFLKWDWVIRVEDHQGQPSWCEFSVSDIGRRNQKAKARTGPAFIIRCPDRPRSKHGHWSGPIGVEGEGDTDIARGVASRAFTGFKPVPGRWPFTDRVAN